METSGHTAASGPEKESFFRRQPRTALLLVNLAGILLVLLVIEILLRAWGHQPGMLDMGHGEFQPLPAGEALRVSQEFYTDSNGLFIANPDSFRSNPEINVNRHGYRNPEFETLDTTKPRLLFLGDSFTWGAQAKPLDSCFADLLRQEGLEVLNLGIPGTGPQQYLQQGLRWIPRLRPAAVVLNFYMGNDVMHHYREIEPQQHSYYMTNIGWLNAWGDGHHFDDPDSAYAYALRRFSIPNTTFLNRLASGTVIGTRIWQLLREMGWISAGYHPQVQKYMEAHAARRQSQPVSGAYLRELRDTCAARGIPFFLCVIPLHTDLDIAPDQKHPGLFDGLRPLIPNGLVREDYEEWPDGHFNNRGHRKYAAFVRDQLDAAGLLPNR